MLNISLFSAQRLEFTLLSLRVSAHILGINILKHSQAIGKNLLQERREKAKQKHVNNYGEHPVAYRMTIFPAHWGQNPL